MSENTLDHRNFQQAVKQQTVYFGSGLTSFQDVPLLISWVWGVFFKVSLLDRVLNFGPGMAVDLETFL